MRIGFVGVSHWHAPMHWKAAISSGLKPDLVWDADQNAAMDFARNKQARVAGTLSELLDTDLDLIVAMGRSESLPDTANSIIDRGIPLVLEKPAARSAEEINQLAKNARRNSCLVTVPLANRFSPAALEFERLKNAGLGGTLLHAHFRIVNGSPNRYARDEAAWLLRSDVSSGGALRNFGIHGIDCALSIANGPLEIDSVVVNRFANSKHDVEDYASLILNGTSGECVTIEAGYTFPTMEDGGDVEWRIATSNIYLCDRGDLVRMDRWKQQGHSDLAPFQRRGDIRPS